MTSPAGARARTPDGSVLFFTYCQSLDEATGYTSFKDANDAPDVFAAAYNVDNGQSAKKWLTDVFENEDLLLLGRYFYPTLSPVSIVGGDEKYFELPVVVADPGPDDLTPPQFFYLYGLGFTPNELGITLNTDLVPASALSFEIAPNPVGSFAKISYTLPESSNTTIEIFNLQGKLVKHIDDTRNRDKLEAT